MKTEYEIRILEIDILDIEQQLTSLGAKKVGDWLQKRYVYAFKPETYNKWLRLRTNGIETTLTIKELTDVDSISGTKETEIIVSDFETTNKILNDLGYTPKSYQENRRIRYMLDDIEFDIDFWPLIPTFLEIEGPNEEKILNVLSKLKFNKENLTTKDIEYIYNKNYGIDLNELPEKVLLEEERKI